MSEKKSAALRPFGMRDKIGYAMGDFGCNLSFALIGTYMIDFYTQFIGLSEETWAIIIIITKAWDAINDPLMGGIIDRKRIGNKGKFKPWIKIGSIGLVVAGALAFLPIPGASYPVKVSVCIITYLLWDVFYTIVNVPYGSLNSAISGDPNERTSLSTWRGIGAGFGTVLMMLLPAFIYDENDVLQGERLIWIGLALGVVAFGAYHLCIIMTTERIQAPPQPKEKLRYQDTLKGIIHNRPLIAMCTATFAMIVFFWSNQQTTKWLFQCYFGNAQFSGIASLISYLPLAFCIPLVGKFVRKWGKKKVAGIPMIVSCIAGALLLVVPMKPGDTASMVIYLIGLMFIQMGGGAFQLICWAMITDCIDYQQIKTGRREEGSVYAVYSLFRKLAQGVSASLVILLMKAVGYVAENGPNQLEGVPERMKNLSIVLMLIGSVIMAVVMLSVYNLGQKEVEQMSVRLGKAPADDGTAEKTDVFQENQ